MELGTWIAHCQIDAERRAAGEPPSYSVACPACNPDGSISAAAAFQSMHRCAECDGIAWTTAERAPPECIGLYAELLIERGRIERMGWPAWLAIGNEPDVLLVPALEIIDSAILSVRMETAAKARSTRIAGKR